MLVKALSRPIANAVMKVPARNTSAIVGAKSRHVSTTVSIFIYFFTSENSSELFDFITTDILKFCIHSPKFIYFNYDFQLITFCHMKSKYHREKIM